MIAAAAIVVLASVIAADDSILVSSAVKNENGFLIHEVESAFQQGKTQINVLQPDNLKAGQKYPAIYVLPVEARNETRYGNGLAEIKKHDLHNKHQAIFIAPTFSHLPWYANHPTEPRIRQETYLLKMVMPFVEKLPR